MLMKIPFSKYQGNGNDFIIILANHFPDSNNKDVIIQQLCARRTGIGADGLFLLSTSNKYNFTLDYYNSDGSWETFCANGSRCVAKFINDLNMAPSTMVFKTGAGIHSAIIKKNDIVSMSMYPPKYKSSLISLEGISGYFIDSGARHFVCHSQSLDDQYIYKLGKRIRFSKQFQPQGINVNFYRITNNIIEIKTYEKGVEQIMLSCASGSTAVIYHLSQSANLHSPATSHSSGGSLNFSFDKKWTEPWVEGPASLVFSGQYELL